MELPGEIVVPPAGHVAISPRLGGVLVDLRVGLGAAVQRGDIVAVVSSREFADAATRYVTASEKVAFAENVLSREEDLFRRRITAEQDFRLVQQTLRQAQAEEVLARETLAALGGEPSEIARRALTEPGTLSHMVVRAPISGVVTEQLVAEGEVVVADRPILAITDTREVWVSVHVHARDLPQVMIGQSVLVTAVGVALSASGRIVQY